VGETGDDMGEGMGDSSEVGYDGAGVAECGRGLCGGRGKFSVGVQGCV